MKQTEVFSDRKIGKGSIEEWRDKLIRDFKIPARYDISCQTVVDLMQLMTPTPFVDVNLLWDGLCVMYDYGFKRGMRYQKNLSKKKVNP